MKVENSTLISNITTDHVATTTAVIATSNSIEENVRNFTKQVKELQE